MPCPIARMDDQRRGDSHASLAYTLLGRDTERCYPHLGKKIPMRARARRKGPVGSGMARQKKPHKTFHINVPEDDFEVFEWLDAQFNKSASMRELIRAAAKVGGIGDLFVGIPAERTPGVRGRAKQPKRGSDLAEQIVALVENPRDIYTPDPARILGEADSQGDDAGNDCAPAVPDGNLGGISDRLDGKDAGAAGVGAMRPRAPSGGKAKRKGGIVMDASVLRSASGKGKAAGKRAVKPSKEDPTEKKEATSKQDKIKDLMDLMDL